MSYEGLWTTSEAPPDIDPAILSSITLGEGKKMRNQCATFHPQGKKKREL